MKLLIRSVWTDMKRDPVRGLLTIMGIGVGVAIVTLTVNVGNTLLAAGRAAFASPGARMIVATAELEGKDGLRYVNDVFTLSDMEGIRTLVPSVTAITPVEGLWVTPQSGVDFGTILAGDFQYRTRSVAAVGAEYAKVYDLRMAAGAFFSAGDMDGGRRVIVIAEAAAQALFGSAAEALGKAIGASQMPGSQRIDYEVVGVFRDVPAGMREAYAIADFLVPLILPPRYLGAFAATVDEPNPNVAAARLTAAVHSLHGQDVKVLSWQGNRWDHGSDPQAGPSREIRSVVLFLDGFGVLALIIASTGILTMMMVGVVERSRSIGLRRALGSRRLGITAWFVGEAVLLSGAGALLGLAAAAIFSGAATAALSPMLPGTDDGMVPASALRLDSVAAAVVSALLAGALFSLPPAIMAARVQPAESMRETW